MEQQKKKLVKVQKMLHAKEMEGRPGSFGRIICFSKDFSRISSVDR